MLARICQREHQIVHRARWPLLKIVTGAGAKDLPQQVPAVLEPYIARQIGSHDPTVQVS